MQPAPASLVPAYAYALYIKLLEDRHAFKQRAEQVQFKRQSVDADLTGRPRLIERRGQSNITCLQHRKGIAPTGLQPTQLHRQLQHLAEPALGLRRSEERR